MLAFARGACRHLILTLRSGTFPDLVPSKARIEVDAASFPIAVHEKWFGVVWIAHVHAS
jgi:hypothetical protein